MLGVPSNLASLQALRLDPCPNHQVLPPDNTLSSSTTLEGAHVCPIPPFPLAVSQQPTRVEAQRTLHRMHNFSVEARPCLSWAWACLTCCVSVKRRPGLQP